MYHSLQVQVRQDNPLHAYLEQTSRLATNLYNAGLFRCRQMFTASGKEPAALTVNEKEVMDEFDRSFPGEKRNAYSYYTLEKLMRLTCNPDFFAEGLSRQTAQSILKLVAQDFKSFFAAFRKYKQDPSAFLGKPNIPGYHKKGGLSTVTFSNQDCIIRKDGQLKFPGTKETLDLGDCPIHGRLKEVKVKPYHDIFVVYLILDDRQPVPEPKEQPERICAIDFGVENIAAITNNVGLPNLLFKGGVLKSQNQWYNKRMAQIKSRQTKGTTSKFVPTVKSQRLCVRRENRVMDFSRKLCKRIVDWCKDNHIDTIVVGSNPGWKQGSSLGKKNNQEFVQIPFYRITQMLESKAQQYGIRFVEQEESYTSKVSYLDNDVIPVYGVNDAEAAFSGKRKPYVYKGQRKPDGFRGLYTTRNGTIVNSDLNGSANIGRKAFPELFANKVNFSSVVIIPHPDYALKKA